MPINSLAWKIWFLFNILTSQIHSLNSRHHIKCTVYPNFIVPVIYLTRTKQSSINNHHQKWIKSISDDNLSDLIEDTLNAATEYELNESKEDENDEILDENVIKNEEKPEFWHEYTRDLLKKTQKEENEKNIGIWKESIKGFNIEAKSSQCPGCGISLQSNDASLPGYIELKEYDKIKIKDIDNLLPLCMRCKGFKGGNVLIDTGNNQDKERLAIGSSIIEASNETSSVLYNTLKKNYHRHISIVYVMDALDLYLDKNIVDYIINRRKEIENRVKSMKECTTESKLTLFYIVVNKIDLIPYDSRKRILCYIHKLFNDIYKELNLKPRHIFLTNSLTGNGVNLFYSVLLSSAEILRSKVFFIGNANSGKSTLLNWLAKFANDNKNPVTPNRLATSIFPGTTLRPIKINIGKSYEIFDTPGLLSNNSIITHLSVENIHIAIPKKHKKPTIYRLKTDESLLLGHFVRIDLEDSKPYFFTPFISGNIPIRVASKKRLCQSLEAQNKSRMYPVYQYDDHGNKINNIHSKVPSNMEDETHMLIPKVYKIIGNGWKSGTVDICIRGLGFISVAGSLKAIIKIYTNPNIEITLREPMFPKLSLPF